MRAQPSLSGDLWRCFWTLCLHGPTRHVVEYPHSEPLQGYIFGLETHPKLQSCTLKSETQYSFSRTSDIPRCLPVLSFIVERRLGSIRFHGGRL